MISGVVIANLW